MSDKQPQQTDQDSEAFFGPWLRQRRRALDLTQDELAQQVGCVADTVRKLEAGMRRPSRAMAERLAHCLVIPAEEQAAFLVAARAGQAPQDRTLPPIPTLSITNLPTIVHRTGHLPAPMTSFIGRAWEVDTVGARLRTPEVRLVTLTGAGGVGKTRLALQIASGLHDAFPHGVWFVNLAPISDLALVISTIAHTVGVREQPGMSPAESLRAALHAQLLLVLLDNFEQVVAAAPELALLLAAVPGLKLLVTSRETLRLSGEHVVVVAPLAVPDPTVALAPEQLAHYAAVQLFVARAQAASEHFCLTDANAPAVAAICARLDGLPLAIELAAAQIPLFPPTALLTRLEQRLPMLTRGSRDLPARQQTIRSTIEWSYDLLDSGEQTLFARLGVFVGGCTLEAAEGMCNAEHDLPVEVLDGLAALMDKSLLRQEEALDGEPRFTMLETIREYALEQLAAHRETEALQRQHATYYLALVEVAERRLTGPQQQPWLNRLETEFANLRAALAWSLNAPEAVEWGLRLAAALYMFWFMHVHYREGRAWLEALLEQSRSLGNPAALLRAKALRVGGAIAVFQNDNSQATAMLEESLALYRDMGDPAGIAEVLLWLGRIAHNQGDYACAERLALEGLALFREQQHSWGIGLALIWLGDLALDRGDLAQAASRFQESLAIYQAAGDIYLGATALRSLGLTAAAQGDHARATPLLTASLTQLRAVGSQDGVALALSFLGWVAHAQGHEAQAGMHFIESLALLRETQTLKDELADCLVGFAGVAGARGQLERAAQLFAAMEALREGAGIALKPWHRARYERDLATTCAQLGPATFAAAWAAGRALTLEQAIAEALAMS